MTFSPQCSVAIKSKLENQTNVDLTPNSTTSCVTLGKLFLLALGLS